LYETCKITKELNHIVLTVKQKFHLIGKFVKEEGMVKNCPKIMA
jgi:hypothetical protein